MTQWKWAAASRRGTAHAQAGTRRQDTQRVVTATSNFIIAVACDGAGSTSHGGAGAAIAVRTLSSLAQSWITAQQAIPSPSIVGDWIEDARQRISACAFWRDLSVNDFATTLVMAMSNGRSTITAQIGDGAIVARRRGSAEAEVLSWPDGGEYAGTTFFLTDTKPRLRIGVASDAPIERLALFTDGLERLALDFATQVAHAPFFRGVFAPVAKSDTAGHNRPLSLRLAAFLDSEPVNARSDDDKTLILAAFG